MENKNLTLAIIILLIIVVGISVGYLAEKVGYNKAKGDLLFNPQTDVCDIAVANNELLDFQPSINQVDCIHIGLSGIGEGLFCVTENMSLPVRCIQWHKQNSDAFHSEFNTQRYYEQGGFFSSQP